MDELAEGVIGVAEAKGGILLREPIDEDGAESFVLSLCGTGRLVEEEPTQGIVHGGSRSVR